MSANRKYVAHCGVGSIPLLQNVPTETPPRNSSTDVSTILLTCACVRAHIQGEVEQISLMKPKAASPHETGLLEYLEDIVGTR